MRLLKIYFCLFLLLCFYSGGASQRFNTVSLIIPPDIQVKNIGEFFSYKEEMKNRIENPHVVLYRNSILEDKMLPDMDYLNTLMDVGFFLRKDFSRSSLPGLISNFRPKYENIAGFVNNYRLDVGDDSTVYLLFINTTLPEQARYYYNIGPSESLKRFYADNIRRHDDNTLFVLFTDTDYYEFRKICDDVDFIDIIINFQNFEQGHIYDRKIYNVPEDIFKAGRLDIMFGRRGFLANSWTEVDFSECPPSDFIRHLLAGRDADEEQ
ncbi:MAG: hypothetical protein ACOCWO_05410 [Candidatus Muiribacteriaceae bacterium]